MRFTVHISLNLSAYTIQLSTESIVACAGTAGTYIGLQEV